MLTSNSHERRRGVIVVIVLALLAVLTVACGLWIRMVLQDVARQRLAEDAVQAAWLAEAGLRRAAARIAVDPTYTDEQWRIEGKEIDRSHAALVKVQVEHPGDSQETRLTVHVAYPESSPTVQLSKTVSFNAAP